MSCRYCMCRTRGALNGLQQLLRLNGWQYGCGLLSLLLLVSVGCVPNNHSKSSTQPPVHSVENQMARKSLSHQGIQGTAERPSKVEPIARTEIQNLESSPALLAQGERVYTKHCMRCHGDQGDGTGELSSSLHPQPTDFTAGVFKFRSTPTGQLPTRDDLFRTISVGVAGTSMSDYGDLSEPDRRAVVEYVRNFSSRFREESAGEPILAPPSRSVTPDAAQRGQELYTHMFCQACHGEHARGDGPLAQSLSDTNGRSIQPADLTKTRLKSGKGPHAIYRSLVTGLDGTPMPSYGDSLTQEEAWDLALYVASLSQSGDGS